MDHPKLCIKGCTNSQTPVYHKVENCSLSWLVAHFQIFRRLMKGKFDAYVLWPLTKKFQNWIVDRSTARDFMVITFKFTTRIQCPTVCDFSVVEFCWGFHLRLEGCWILALCTAGQKLWETNQWLLGELRPRKLFLRFLTFNKL